MLDFLRPVQDSSLRIMIPAKQQSSLTQDESPGEFDEDEREPILGHSCMTTAGPSHYSAGTFLSIRQSSSPYGGNGGVAAPRAHRQYKTYTVMQRSGFQHTEYVQIITHLCKAEILISLIFLIHGFTCPGYPDESSYQGTCHINVLAALVGIFTGGMGLGAVHRFRWKTVLVMWLIMCIISSVANLLAVITTGVWLDHLSKLKVRTGIANGLSGMMLLGSVLVGVCFILTSVLICHYWASNSTKYQTVGKIAKKARVLKRRPSRANSGDSPNSCRHHNGYHSGYGSGGGGGRHSRRIHDSGASDENVERGKSSGVSPRSSNKHYEIV